MTATGITCEKHNNEHPAEWYISVEYEDISTPRPRLMFVCDDTVKELFHQFDKIMGLQIYRLHDKPISFGKWPVKLTDEDVENFHKQLERP